MVRNFSGRWSCTFLILWSWQRPITGRSNTSKTARRSAFDPSSTARIGRVTSSPRSRSPTISSVTSVVFSVDPSTSDSGVFRAVDADAQCHHAAVLAEVHPVDHERHKIQRREVRGEQLGQGGLGLGDESA